GQIGLIDDHAKFDRYIVSNKQMKMTPDPSQADSRFLYYYLSQPQWVDYVRSQAIGSSVPGFNLGQLRALQVRVPHLTEQRAIAEVLGALDDKIAANGQLANTADLLAASLTRRALDGVRVPLGQIAALTMGSSPPGNSYNEDGVGSVFYQGVRDFGARFPTNRVWTTEPVRLAEPGDSLISVRAPVGRVNRASELTCIGRGLAAARSLDGRPATLFYLLRHAPEVWEPYEAEGTVFGSINKAQLTSLLVPSVRESERIALESWLAALEQRITAALCESGTLTQVRDALLPQLMSGKIRVKDAERAVSEAV
ncbi:MAG TPA: restriction endonuclease subunit S, partial [Actinomycetales bacterium]|nr:restriction endonuclease subunit S [Actinomycetales bacterium]